jgi:hypothetical protein
VLKVGVNVTQSGDDIIYTLDKTYKQIVDAVNGGIMPYICMELRGGTVAVKILAEYFSDGTDYSVDFGAVYYTTSENGYPSYTDDGGK